MPPVGPCCLPNFYFVKDILYESKCAFPPGKGGNISISMKQENGRVYLSVVDDGVGLTHSSPENNEKKIGLELIKTLSKQLNGTFAIHSKNGTSVTIDFLMQ